MTLTGSVAHYTSLEVINIILNSALSSDNGEFTLHLSHLAMMNDLGESRYVLDKYFTHSNTKKKLKDEWDSEFYPLNIPFILSTISTDRHTCNNGSLPMWKMYGDDCKGAFIRFDKNKLYKFCKDNGYEFMECNYCTVNEVSEIITKFNMKKGAPPFDELLYESSFTKRIDWEYEKEWRVLVKSNNGKIKTKNTSRGIVEYIEIAFPIKLIEEICIGPLANQDNTLASLDSLKNKLRAKFVEKNIDFNIKKSKIQIR